MASRSIDKIVAVASAVTMTAVVAAPSSAQTPSDLRDFVGARAGQACTVDRRGNVTDID